MKLHLFKSYSYNAFVADRFTAIFREKCHRPRLRPPIFEYLDCPLPRLLLTVVYLAEVQDLPLHYAAARNTPILHYAPVAMVLPVLLSAIASKKHFPSNTRSYSARQWVGLHYKPFRAFWSSSIQIISAAYVTDFF
jgi:hypothetical protein